MASMPKTLAGIGMSIDEWEANRQARGFENALTAVVPFLVYAEPKLDIIPILHGTRLQVTDVSQSVNEVPKKVYMRVGPGMECHIEAHVVEEFTAPAGLAVSQIRSGNRHLRGSSIPSEVKKQRKTLTDSDPQPLEVRILVDAIEVVLMDGSISTFSAGHVVDVCASSHVENFCVIRFEDNRIAPMWRSQLEKISRLKVEEHTLLVAHKKAYGLGHLGHLFPMEKGAKVLLTAKCHHGNVFVLTEDQIKESLFDMTAEESILQAPERAGVKGLYSEWGGWRTHRHHNDRVASAGVFTLGKNRLAAMDLNLPLLNAYGEAKSTIVKSQGKSTVEVLLRDIPFAPARIASNEWGPVMGTIYTLGFGFGTGGSGGWAEIVARMPCTTRTYCSWYRDHWTDTSRRYRLVPDKILNIKSSKRMDNVIKDNPMSPLFQANNTLRGIASGLVDPAKPYGKPVKDVAGYWHAANLVLFAFNDPSEKHPIVKFRELNSGSSSREHRTVEARKKKIKEQTGAVQNAPVAADESDNDGKHEEC
ncbi:hypothetical protein CBER1_09619 [Cercospora berteroae]|uniref:Uncharacterized protein n=1 Tax=Cercospora berteroae TaxID=357750 RepID=A0A2S6BXD4_9PEZI|nr:hypothetical protein CBER1_09619 [Cercospora berteroae]